MEKLLIVCGPTATGKTNLALKLAKRFNGEIVSFDSRQVYKSMDIGTGKDIKGYEFKNGFYVVKGIKIWLYDLVSPNYRFNVVDFIKESKKVVGDIWKRNKLPILVGGTGFYLQGLIEDVENLGVLPDFELREGLDSLSLIDLQDKLKKLNFQRWGKMNDSDRKKSSSFNESN